MAKWFYLVDGQEIGPLEARQLRLLALAGKLVPSDLVRREDMADWYEARNLNGLFGPPQLPATSPPPAHNQRQTDQKKAKTSGSDRSDHRGPFGKRWPVVVVATVIFFGLYVHFAIVDRQRKENLRNTIEHIMQTAENSHAAPLAAKRSPWVSRTLQELTASPDSLAPKGQQYVDSTIGFSIDFPPGWTVKKPLANEEIAIKANHLGANHRLATIIVKTAELGSDAPRTYEDFKAISCPDGEGIQLIDSSTTTLDGRETHWFETTQTIMDRPAYVVAFALLQGSRAYLLEAIVVTEDRKWLDVNAPIMLKSIQSFRATKPIVR